MLPSVKDARPLGKSVRFGADDEVEYDDEDQAVFDRHISGLGGAGGRTPSLGAQDPSRTQGRGSTGRASTRGSMKSGKTRFAGDEEDGGWSGKGESQDFFPDDEDELASPKPPSARLGTSHRSPPRRAAPHPSSYNVGAASARWQQVTEQPKPGGQAAEVLDRLLGKGSAAGFKAAPAAADRPREKGDFLRVESAPGDSPPDSPDQALQGDIVSGGAGGGTRDARSLWGVAKAQWRESTPPDPDVKRMGLPVAGESRPLDLGDVVRMEQERVAREERQKARRLERMQKSKQPSTMDPKLAKALAYFRDKAGETEVDESRQWLSEAVKDVQVADAASSRGAGSTWDEEDFEDDLDDESSVGGGLGGGPSGRDPPTRGSAVRESATRRSDRVSTGRSTGRRRTALRRKKASTLVKDNEGTHQYAVNCLCFSDDGELMVSGGGDGCVVFKRRNEERSTELGYETWDEEASLFAHFKCVWGLDLSLKGDMLATAGGDDKVKVWVVGQKLAEHIDPVDVRKMLGEKKELSTGTPEEIMERLRLVMSHEANEAKRNGFFAKYTQGERQWVCSAVYSPKVKAKEEAGPGATGSIQRLMGQNEGNPCFGVKIHPDGVVLVSAWADGMVRAFSGKRVGQRKNKKGLTYLEWSWRCFQTIDKHSDSVFGLTYTPSGGHLLTTSKDELVLIFAHPRRLRDGYVLQSRLRGHMAPALSVAVHPSGILLATASCDQTAVLWAVPDRGKMGQARENQYQSIATVIGHTDYVKGVAFREDGRVLATASRDRTVRLYAVPANPAGRTHPRVLFCLDRLKARGEIFAVTFGRGPTAARLVVGCFGGGITVWDTGTRVEVSIPEAPPLPPEDPVWDPAEGPPGESRGGLVLHDEGRALDASRASSRPATAMSDWSRMADPNDVAPRLDTAPAATARGEGGDARRELTLYTRSGVSTRGGLREEAVWPKVETMGPSEGTAKAGPKHDFTASSTYARDFRTSVKSRLSSADFAKLDRTAVMFFKGRDPAGWVELDREALVVVAEVSGFLDVASINKVLARLEAAVAAAGGDRIRADFPRVRAGRKAEFLLGRWELEVLLGLAEIPDPKKGFGSLRDIIETAAEVQEEGGGHGPGKAPKPVVSQRGDDLAAELCTRPLTEARRVVGEKIMELISPLLSWTKAGGLAGRVTSFLLRALEAVREGEGPSESLRRLCHLCFHTQQLMEKVSDAMVSMEREGLAALGGRRKKAISRAPTSEHDGGQGGHTTIDTLRTWPGLKDMTPEEAKRNRCQSALFASASPTWVGCTFCANREGSVSMTAFSTYVTLGSTATTLEARDRDRSKQRGVSFRMRVCEWDAEAERIGAVLYEGEEVLVLEREWRMFDLSMEGHVEVGGRQSLFLCLSSEGCTRYTHGAAWVAALGLPDERSARHGAKPPEPPPELSGGMWVLAGEISGANARFVRQDEVMACRVTFSSEE